MLGCSTKFYIKRTVQEEGQVTTAINIHRGRIRSGKAHLVMLLKDYKDKK